MKTKLQKPNLIGLLVIAFSLLVVTGFQSAWGKKPFTDRFGETTPTSSVVNPVQQANEIILESQTHRETWNCGKDYEWTYNPKLAYNPESVTVYFNGSFKKYSDRFCGVAGEIEFSTAEFSVASVAVVFDDGTTASAEILYNYPPEISTKGGKKITQLTLQNSVASRTWAFTWKVDAKFKPEVKKGTALGAKDGERP